MSFLVALAVFALGIMYFSIVISLVIILLALFLLYSFGLYLHTHIPEPWNIFVVLAYVLVLAFFALRIVKNWRD
ncbi:hypothetical protein DMB92_04080 [Campylobacter sp. MIT 99-7217]|uniref:hypothetical protein n=1 Tax=Campylobacter sp. MIT 99-7217 TaxID=535091 RepID=UPI00115BE91D|nr:hypothetical protein [Campylobacter sp. MIT 99-7217]TQR33143.1 hypothetical protein DMB92_04080 [Campylobacter sp. MIT 99-7217]